MKKILFILILSANAFADNQPVIRAARTILRQGKLEFGVRNITSSNVAGVIKFENAAGVELLANGFGFELAPKETEYRSIPIRNATKDLPLLTCDVIIFDNAKSRLYKSKVQCKSGALFRDIGVNETAAKSYSSNRVRFQTGEKSLGSFYIKQKCVINNLFFNQILVINRFILH